MQKVIFKGENSADLIFMKYTFNISVCRETCEPTCFKLSMVLDTTELYSLIPVLMTLMFTQGHRVMGKLEIMQLFYCKVA